jgi:hypothetical protein
MARAVSSIPSACCVAPDLRRRSGLSHQRLQRRLQTVGQIGGAGSGALGLGVTRGQQIVDFGRHRAQLDGPVAAHALGPPLSQGGDACAEVPQWAQPTDNCTQPAALSASASKTR